MGLCLGLGLGLALGLVLGLGFGLELTERAVGWTLDHRHRLSSCQPQTSSLVALKQ